MQLQVGQTIRKHKKRTKSKFNRNNIWKVYPSNDPEITNTDNASKENYAENTKIYGDAVRETSSAGTGDTSWYFDGSSFPGDAGPFLARGGRWTNTNAAGLFCFIRGTGSSIRHDGFRAVLVAQ